MPRVPGSTTGTWYVYHMYDIPGGIQLRQYSYYEIELKITAGVFSSFFRPY